MKGPGLRISLDVRRTWRCPRCDRVVKQSGDVVAQRCTCSSDPVWMQMTDLPRRPKAVQRAVVRPATADEAADACDQDEVSLPNVEAAIPASAVENASMVEPSPPTPPAEVSVTMTEIEVQITPVPESPVPVADPAPPAAPPADDFGAGLVD